MANNLAPGWRASTARVSSDVLGQETTPRGLYS